MQGKIQRSFIFMGWTMAYREVDISIAELGKILRLVRKESGLTQRNAAALCNVSLPFLNGLEQGKPTAGGNQTQLFQALLLGPWLSMFGKQKMGALTSTSNQEDCS